jgi:CheY-like chemotaxis protein/HPt (histidine-containing phosphotransfer) domain-containing protein
MPPISVLLVDDQRFVGAALERLLAGEQDIELHCCLNAVDAIARANQIGPTLILQDLVLPDIDGLTMVKMFRANPSTAGTPIIVLSGNDDAESRIKAIASGANDYLVKLPARQDLVASIRRHAMGNAAATNGSTAASVPAAAPPEPHADETLDRRVIAQFRQETSDGVPEFMLVLIDQFIQEAASQVEVLRDAGQRRDAAAVKAAAHSLKGSSMTMGARRLAALCSQIEDHAGRHPTDAVASALMVQLDQEFVKVRTALEAERQGQL